MDRSHIIRLRMNHQRRTPSRYNECSSAFRFTSASITVAFDLPFASTVKFSMSPRGGRRILQSCFFLSGLNARRRFESGPSHFGTAWKWIACSPAGRFFRFSLIATPSAHWRSSLFHALPLPSFNCTITFEEAFFAAAGITHKREAPLHQCCFIAHLAYKDFAASARYRIGEMNQLGNTHVRWVLIGWISC